MKLLVFFPTYNEEGNVRTLIAAIREHLPPADILVVDDASPDGTGEILDELAARMPELTILHRPGKLGVGSAHKLAMLYARDHDYDGLITMDADFSHHPKYLPRFPELLEAADFVTGSRYVEGGESDYGLWRTFISLSANLAAKTALGLELKENTTLYRGFTGDLLRRMNIDAIRSEGYSFAVESIHQVAQLTDRMAEFPIHFENRAAGASKINRSEIYKAVLTIQRLGLRRMLRRPSPVAPAQSERVNCRVCGGTHHVEVFPPRSGGNTVAQDTSPYSCATLSTRTHGQILKCLQCGLVFMRPELSDERLVDEYRDAVDPTYLEHLDARETTFRYNLEQVRRHVRPGDRVLEVGSYCGGFLKIAREEGLDIMGLEPSKWAVEASAKVTDAKVVCGTIDELPGDVGRFDVVVAWDVLEHFADPVAELEKMNRILKPGGILLMSTLMIDNWFPKLAGRHWPWLMDMHLYYFTEASVRNTVGRACFDVVEDMVYCHVVTAEYLMKKLGTLGVPGSSAVSRLLAANPAGNAQIPFRFGDIKLFVCKKVSEVDEGAQSGTQRSLGGVRTANGSGEH